MKVKGLEHPHTRTLPQLCDTMKPLVGRVWMSAHMMIPDSVCWASMRGLQGCIGSYHWSASGRSQVCPRARCHREAPTALHVRTSTTIRPPHSSLQWPFTKRNMPGLAELSSGTSRAIWCDRSTNQLTNDAWNGKFQSCVSTWLVLWQCQSARATERVLHGPSVSDH